MRKIAAHYYLRPDGSIGKFPVITFDDKGTITEIRERDRFTEEPFMEHVNGLLVPGLISCLSEKDCVLPEDELRKLLRQMIAYGHVLLGCSENHVAHLKSLAPQKLRILSFKREDSFYIYNEMSQSENLLSVFQLYLIEKSELWQSEQCFGALKVGYTPGILAMSNIGKEPFQFTENSKIKRII